MNRKSLSPFEKHLTPSRRSFLKSIGAGLAAFPLIDLLADSVAQAAGEELPLKFIGIYHPHGIAAEHWVMRQTDTETNFDLGFQNSSLQPFDDAATYGKSFKDKILLIEGIDLFSEANGHDTAGTILTGSRISGTKPFNSSLDHFLAVEQGLGSTTKLSNLPLAVGVDDTASGFTLSFGPGGAALPKIIDPSKAFDLLFSGFVTGDDPDAAAKAAHQRAMGKSLIDFLNSDVGRLKTRIAPREQQKLDQHLTAIRELEKQFEVPTVGQGCTPPGKPQPFSAIKMYNGGEPYFDAITDVMINLIAQAVACDVVRFVTLFMNDLSYAANPLGLPADNHGAVAHTYNSSPVGHDGQPSGDGDPTTWVPLAKFNKYSYSKIASLMQHLDASSMLDSSLIYASSDMGNPALHSTRNVPTLIAGGANGKFRMGRRIKMQMDCPTASPWCMPNDATFVASPNNRLLISIAQAFGQELESFGTQADPDLAKGALEDVF
jgi:hypothetical protein